jgi:hypothetical protein
VAMAQCVSAGSSTEIVPVICSGLSRPIEIEKVQVFDFDSPVSLLAGSIEAFVVCSSVMAWAPDRDFAFAGNGPLATTIPRSAKRWVAGNHDGV